MPAPDKFNLSVLTLLLVLVIVGGDLMLMVMVDVDFDFDVRIDDCLSPPMSGSVVLLAIITGFNISQLRRKFEEEVFTIYMDLSWLRKRISQLTCATVTILV